MPVKILRIINESRKKQEPIMGQQILHKAREEGERGGINNLLSMTKWNLTNNFFNHLQTLKTG